MKMNVPKYDDLQKTYEKEPEDGFKFVCAYCGYESNSNDEECFQCGCRRWLYMEDLTPGEKDAYGIE